MKLLFISDPHGDFKNLKCAKEYADTNIHPDATIIAGDLVDMVFDEKDAAIHAELFERMYAFAKQELNRKFSAHGSPYPISPYEQVCLTQEIARQVLVKKHFPDSLKNLARYYLHHLYSTAGKSYERQYSTILEIMGQNIMVLPGNYDTNLEINYDIDSETRESALHKQNMHKKKRTIDDIVFGGYGGASSDKGLPIGPMTVPYELTVPFNEYPSKRNAVFSADTAGKIMPKNQTNSEPFYFLNNAEPDIAITHIPPRGLCDKLAHKKSNNTENNDDGAIHAGSEGIRKYAETGKSKIILCGHIHEGKGVIWTGKENKTVVINPGSLSSVRGNSTFAVVETENNGVFKSARIYRIINPNDAEHGIFHEESYVATPFEIKEISVNTKSLSPELFSL